MGFSICEFLDKMWIFATACIVPVFVFLGTATFVLVVVKLRASVALSAQPWWLFAGFRLVIGQDVGGVQPLGIIVQQATFLI